MDNFIITFNDGYTASYFNCTSLQAIRMATRDHWQPGKKWVVDCQPRPTQIDVWDIPLD